MPIYMPFSDDAEETFSRALKLLQVSNSIKTIFLFHLSYTSVEVGKSVSFVFALSAVESKNLLKEAGHVTLVQSGAQPIWRRESTHHIQVRKVQAD